MTGRKCTECGRGGPQGAHLMCQDCYKWHVLVAQGMKCAYCGDDLSTYERWQYQLCDYTTFTAMPGESEVDTPDGVVKVANRVGCRKCYNKFRAEGVLQSKRHTGMKRVSYSDVVEQLPPEVATVFMRQLEERMRIAAIKKFGADRWNCQPLPNNTKRFHFLRLLQEHGYNPEDYGFKLHGSERLQEAGVSKKPRAGTTCKCVYCEETRGRGRQIQSGDWLCTECADMPID